MIDGAIRFVKLDSFDPKAVNRAHALIRLLYESSRRTPLFQVRRNVRFRELETVFAHYWRGTQLPDDDAGRDCLWIAGCHLWHLSKKCGPIAAIRAWAAHWAPWCGEDELAALITCVEADPRKWKADPMAVELGLPIKTRDALGLTTIGSIDLDQEGRKQRRKDRKRQERAEHRRKNGVATRPEYLAKNSKSRTKLWVALGISRATYYRQQREIETETGPCTANSRDILVSTDLSHGESHKSQPWTEFGISRATYYRRRARAPQARGRLSVMIRPDVLEGEIVVDSGVAVAPPPNHLERAIARARRLQQQDAFR
jgi:hypothetical protein